MKNEDRKIVSVITTIQEPTNCMRVLSKKLAGFGGLLIVAGDEKGPESYNLENARFLNIEAQEKGGYSLAERLPTKHYSRKNIGYLHAMELGATCIYETDDDNQPNKNWTVRSESLMGVFQPTESPNWLNIYRYFSKASIWPRGLPLANIHDSIPDLIKIEHERRCPIQQGLVNNAPDVDAVWRLVFDRPFSFDTDATKTVVVPAGVWVPFNTQSTWWWPVAFPLLYIPSYCSFRMCDIWKSFVAQRCLWELGFEVAFHAPEVRQDRNAHDLTKDFIDEIPGYLQNDSIVTILRQLQLKPGESYVKDNLLLCYNALVKKGVFPDAELELVKLWITDIDRIT